MSGISPIVEIEQVERLGEALDLNSRRLDFQLAQIIQHARPYQGHDQAYDRNDDEHFNEREPGFSSPRPERPRSERRVTTMFITLIPNVIAPSD